MSQNKDSTEKQKLKEAFNHLDKDKDGLVNSKEIIQALSWTLLTFKIKWSRSLIKEYASRNSIT